MLSCSMNGVRWYIHVHPTRVSALQQSLSGPSDPACGKYWYVSWWLCNPRPICFRLLVQLMRLAASRIFWTAGRRRPIRIAMMAITTNNSIKVNADLVEKRRSIFTSGFRSGNDETSGGGQMGEVEEWLRDARVESRADVRRMREEIRAGSNVVAPLVQIDPIASIPGPRARGTTLRPRTPASPRPRRLSDRLSADRRRRRAQPQLGRARSATPPTRRGRRSSLRT